MNSKLTKLLAILAILAAIAAIAFLTLENKQLSSLLHWMNIIALMTLTLCTGILVRLRVDHLSEARASLSVHIVTGVLVAALTGLAWGILASLALKESWPLAQLFLRTFSHGIETPAIPVAVVIMVFLLNCCGYVVTSLVIDEKKAKHITTE
ncbi:hypothetical protein KBC79_06645 [Candidatus Woesebacteria bacterium]|nr:hypothetical protein [Candidatus Woesebacteria bacterium]